MNTRIVIVCIVSWFSLNAADIEMSDDKPDHVVWNGTEWQSYRTYTHADLMRSLQRICDDYIALQLEAMPSHFDSDDQSISLHNYYAGCLKNAQEILAQLQYGFGHLQALAFITDYHRNQ